MGGGAHALVVDQQGLGALFCQGLQWLGMRGKEIERGAHFALHGFCGQVAAGRAFEQAVHAVIGQPLRIGTATHGQGHGLLGHHLERLATAHVAELMAQAQQIDRGGDIDVVGQRAADEAQGDAVWRG